MNLFFKTIKFIALLALAAIANGCMHNRMQPEQETQRLQDKRAIVNNNIKMMYGVVKMAKNIKFCRPSEDGKSLEYAPVIIPPKTSAPTEIEYNLNGWYKNSIQPPEIPEGKVVSSTTYVIDGLEVIARYEYVDIQYSIDDYDAAMEEHLRTEREARGYTTREPDSYLTSNHPRWKRDAEDWVTHRDAVMEYALQLINDVQSGIRPPPTMEEFKAGLPVIHWSVE